MKKLDINRMDESNDIKILYMEDDPGLARLVQKRLERVGYEVDLAPDGETGLEMYKTGSYDVVAVDHSMPVYSGLEVIRMLAARDILPPMIMITGSGSEEVAVEAIQLGAGDYVVKDIEGGYLNLLPTVIERVLLQRRLVEARQQAEEALRHRVAELEALAQVSAALRNAQHVDEMLHIVLAQAVQVVGAAFGCIFILDPETEDLIAQVSYPPDFYPLGVRHSLGEGITGHVAMTGEVHVTDNVQEDPLSQVMPEEMDLVGALGSTVALPLQTQDAIIGVMHIAFGAQIIVSDDKMRLLIATVDIAANAIRRAMVVAGLESEVAARTAEIRAEQEKSEAILRSVGEAITMMDLEKRIRYVNEAFETLTGYTEEEALGRQIEFLIDEQAPEQTRQSWKRAWSRGDAWQGEMTLRHKEGRIYEATISFSPMQDALGDLVGYVASHRDITKIKDLDRARSRFIANVSHQLRTPVTVMQLYIHLMRQRGAVAKAEQYLDALEDVTNQLTHLIQDILEMATLDSGQAVSIWGPVTMDTIIGVLVTRYGERIKEAGLSLDWSIAPDLPVIKGDQDRLIQALGEIVENAINFTPSDSRISIAVDTARKDERTWVTIAVEDTGPGIPANEQEKVFDRFFRGSLVEAGQIPGTGLGLSFVHEILRAHGGRMTMSSEVGTGSTFTMWLPTIQNNKPVDTLNGMQG
ncbi:MAG TPA: PAS domain S-box protein [Chloroflexi bacterium]|nr:PAS domain S-box protein [Chloroflexota bacterium]